MRIHIDHEAYDTPVPATGAALYKLGGVADHHELFREVDGNHEDELIRRDSHEIHLKQDEHFYSQKLVTIIVNGRKRDLIAAPLTFDKVVSLAFDSPPSGPNILFTVTYRNGPRKNPDGTLIEGRIIRIKGGMVFNVTATDKS